MCERITEVKGKRIKFMKDAEAYLHNVIEEEHEEGHPSASASVFEMKPDGIFELETRADNLLHMVEGSLFAHDLGTDKYVAIYTGDMAYISKGTKIRCRTGRRIGCKCVVVSKPALKTVYPELAEVFMGGQAKIRGTAIPRYPDRLKE